MFEIFKKNDVLYSPVKGTMIPLTEVPDPMFSQKLMGDGVAFEMDEGIIYAPCYCEVMMIATTKHAIGLRVSKKHEIMIHIGLDTVNFNGEGFELLVDQGDKVKKGQPLVKVNLKFFSEHHINMITPMIITSKQSQFEIYAHEVVDENCQVIKFI